MGRIDGDGADIGRQAELALSRRRTTPDVPLEGEGKGEPAASEPPPISGRRSG
jgi:hypothetical protein